MKSDKTQKVSFVFLSFIYIVVTVALTDKFEFDSGFQS